MRVPLQLVQPVEIIGKNDIPGSVIKRYFHRHVFSGPGDSGVAKEHGIIVGVSVIIISELAYDYITKGDF